MKRKADSKKGSSPRKRSKAFTDLSVDEVASFLAEKGLGKHAAAFKEQGIDGSSLLQAVDTNAAQRELRSLVGSTREVQKLFDAVADAVDEEEEELPDEDDDEQASVVALFASLGPDVDAVVKDMVGKSVQMDRKAVATTTVHLRTFFDKTVCALYEYLGATSNCSDDVVAAVHVAMPGILGKHAAAEITKANFRHVLGAPSQLKFKVPTIEKLLAKYKLPEKYIMTSPSSPSAAVAMTAALEYLAAELVELAGKQREEASKSQAAEINEKHLKAAISGDAELSELLQKLKSNTPPFDPASYQTKNLATLEPLLTRRRRNRYIKLGVRLGLGLCLVVATFVAYTTV